MSGMRASLARTANGRSRRGLFILVAVALHASPAEAQRMPVEGSRVRLHLVEGPAPKSSDADILRGTLVTLTNDSVLLRVHEAAAPTTVARSAIERMDVSRGVPNRFESALRSVPASAAVGMLERLLVRAFGMEGTDDEEVWESALIGAAGGAVIGAVIGAVAPRERWERVRDAGAR